MDTTYQILGTYKGNTEVLDGANNLKEAQYLVKEYRMAFGNDWIIKIKTR